MKTTIYCLPFFGPHKKPGSLPFQQITVHVEKDRFSAPKDVRTTENSHQLQQLARRGEGSLTPLCQLVHLLDDLLPAFIPEKLTFLGKGKSFVQQA
jgi:hypothetical protein